MNLTPTMMISDHSTVKKTKWRFVSTAKIAETVEFDSPLTEDEALYEFMVKKIPANSIHIVRRGFVEGVR